jgi:hypothetical protein
MFYVRWSITNHHHQGKSVLLPLRVGRFNGGIRISSTNQKGGIMIEERLTSKGIRLTAKGKRWAENFEGSVIALGILLVFGIVGSIESGRWFG